MDIPFGVYIVVSIHLECLRTEKRCSVTRHRVTSHLYIK